MSGQNFPSRRFLTLQHILWLAFGIILLAVPLLVALSWGEPFEDVTYHAYQVARVLTTQGTAVNGLDSLSQAPLFILVLAANSANALKIGLIFSALGWSATAVTVFYMLFILDRSLAGLVAALLIIISPVIVTTAGTAFSWVVALGWLALTMSTLAPSPPNRKWALGKSIILILMLGLHYDASTVLFVLAVLLLDIYERRIGWLPLLLVAVLAFAWGYFAILRFGLPPNLYPYYWLHERSFLLTDQGQHWLFVPFVLAGIADIWAWKASDKTMPTRLPFTRGQQAFILAMMWTAVTIFSDSAVATAVATVTVITLAALGVTWLIDQLLNQDLLILSAQQSRQVLLIIFVISLLLVQSVSLWRHHSSRSDAQTKLEAQAATWIQKNAPAQATLFASSRIGFLAARNTFPAQMERVTEGNIGNLHTILLEQEPDYIISEQTLPWDYIIRSGWFKERYIAREIFASNYAPDAPLTIWQYNPSPFEQGTQQNTEAVVADSFALVGYQFEPQVVHPGDDVFLTLDLKALQPIANGFITAIHISAYDGWVWSYREEKTPRSLPGALWQPGQVIPERFHLELPEDLPLGAFRVEVFWRPATEDEHWPVYRDGDDNTLDRVQLGYVIVPPPVDMQYANPVDATFSENILLKAVEIGTAIPGEPLEVVLYWDTLAQPDEDYTVFVGLMDAKGEVVAIHNSMPIDNRFPTQAFKPGNIVSDSHGLDLPPDLPPNTYQLFAGLYLLETGERLPVRSADGVAPADRVLKLSEIEVGSSTAEEGSHLDG